MKQSKHHFLALMAIAMLIFTGSCTNKANEKSPEQKDAISATHSEVQDSLNELSRQDSIKENTDSEMCRLYCQVMDSLGINDMYPNFFFLYDITNDGIPELWAGDSHIITPMISVYQFVDHQLKCIGYTSLDHGGFISSDEGLFHDCGHMDYYSELKYTFDGKEVDQTETWKCHMTPEKWEKTGGEIPFPHHKNQKEIDLIDYTGHQSIRDALKNY